MRRVLAIILLLLFLLGCSAQKKELSEMQKEACISADNGNSCGEKLLDIGIVKKEDCCSILKKCC